MDGDGVMGGANNSKLGEKTTFWKLVFGDNKGEEAEGREKGGRGGRRYCHGRRFIPEERFMISIQFPTLCAKFKKIHLNVLVRQNMYIVLRRNSFRYCGYPTFPFTLNPYFKFPFEGNSCQSNSFCY